MITKFKSLLTKKGYDIIRHKKLPEWLHHHNVDLVVDIGAIKGREAETPKKLMIMKRPILSLFQFSKDWNNGRPTW